MGNAWINNHSVQFFCSFCIQIILVKFKDILPHTELKHRPNMWRKVLTNRTSKKSYYLINQILQKRSVGVGFFVVVVDVGNHIIHPSLPSISSIILDATFIHLSNNNGTKFMPKLPWLFWRQFKSKERRCQKKNWSALATMSIENSTFNGRRQWAIVVQMIRGSNAVIGEFLMEHLFTFCQL